MSGAAPPAERVRVEGIVSASRSILDGAKDLSRRSRRFSWASWGFLYAVWGGVILLTILLVLFPSWISTPLANGGVSMTEEPPLAYLPLAFAPAALVLFWAVRELFAGRAAARAVIRGTPPGALPTGGPDDSSGWTQQVVDAQKLLTAAKLETDWSFLPIALGLLSCVGTLAASLTAVLGGATGYGPYPLIGAGAAAFCVALYFLYRVAQQWIGGFQDHLDRQVREVSALEAEFLWRFTGSPA